MEDAEFMLNQLELTDSLKRRLREAVQEVRLSPSDADELRDFCAEKLDVSGFDESYEPTELGKRLERLVDQLFIG